MMVAVWAGAQALWLKFAYDLEFLGKNVYHQLWACSVLFLLVNCWELCEIILAYQWSSDADSDRAIIADKAESRKDI